MAAEDLFAPSLQEHARPRTAPLPWRVSSQFWPAFFGGSLAVGAVAWQNGKRLGLAPERQRWIAVSTLVAFVVATGLMAYFMTLPRDSRLWSRRAVQAVGVVLYLVLARIQQPADRRHQMFDGKYASLWGPGFLALLGSVAVTLLVAFAVVVATAR